MALRLGMVILLPKLVRKFRPTDKWYIGEFESWLTDMAQDGLLLRKNGSSFAYFEKCDPQNLRYRIDISTIGELKTEQKEMYNEYGWDFVAKYSYFNIFSSPTYSNVTELHTDPGELSFTIEFLTKKHKFATLFALLALFLYIGISVAFILLRKTPTLDLIEGMLLYDFIASLFFINTTYASIRSAASIKALKRKLVEGNPINHSAPWKKHRRRGLVFYSIWLVVGISYVIVPFIQFVTSRTEPLPVQVDKLPIVRLADLEQNSRLEMYEPGIPLVRDAANKYNYRWSPIAPVQYKSNEYGRISGVFWEEGGVYSPSIRTKYYKLRFPTLGKNLVSDLVRKDNDLFSLNYRTDLTHSFFDILLVNESEGYNLMSVYAVKDDLVIYVRYRGYATINTVFEIIAQKIQSASSLE